MKRGLMIAVAALLAIASTASMAFEEQQMKGGPAAAPSSAPRATGGSQIDPKSLGISPSDLRSAKPEAGTKIRIPGLGYIGEIPKIDFGMELLYGANQPKQLENDRSEASGVMLRGTVPLKSR